MIQKEVSLYGYQFGNINRDKETSISITLGRHIFSEDGEPISYSGSNYTEDTAQNHKPEYGNNTIAKDINDFISKTNASGGYYISRYEAGDATATSSARTSSTSDSNPIVSKAGVYPYNYITQPQAASLCKSMYNNSNFESDLVNSYAWDTTIVFIQEFSGDNEYSRKSRLQNTIARCGEATDGENKDIRCSIYDMAGNTSEWSTETGHLSPGSCIFRGGTYYTADTVNNSNIYTSDRNFFYPNRSNATISARIILYL